MSFRRSTGQAASVLMPDAESYAGLLGKSVDDISDTKL